MIHFFLQICLFTESSGDSEVWSLLLKKVLGFVLEPCRGLELPGGEGPFQILFGFQELLFLPGRAVALGTGFPLPPPLPRPKAGLSFHTSLFGCLETSPGPQFFLRVCPGLSSL